VGGLDEVPPDLQGDKGVVKYNIPLRAAVMVFFKTTSGVLTDQKVRQALVRATNDPQIIQQLGYPAREVREPLLIGQLGYDASLAQPRFNLKDAQKQLDEDGWKTGNNGVRSKNGQELEFTLVAPDTPESRMVTRNLQKQWAAAGVRLTVRLLGSDDFQSALTNHSYDAILNGISIGTDPDVFVYWDSSQADVRSSQRLNLSEYKNTTADTALEAGRTRLDPALRVIKYKPFLQAWQQDAPAVGLYQPRYLYLTNGPVAGLTQRPINSPTDRFEDVQDWMIREAKVTD
jgi:peptide/nickel transport system substrate-binding protein